MALAQCDFCSATLGMNTGVTVLLPERRHQPRTRENKRHPVLYALHGHGMDHTSWLRNSLLEYLLQERDVIVVMPDAARGFYTDGARSHNYFTYLTEELPLIVQNTFHASDRRKDTFITGISMGGYGALKAAFQRPDLYAAVAAISPVIDPCVSMLHTPPGMFSCTDMERNIENIFGHSEAFHQSADHLPNAFDALLASGAPLPRIYQCCGKQDFLYSENRTMRDHIANTGASLHFEDGDGEHNWTYWNHKMPEALRHFGLVAGNR